MRQRVMIAMAIASRPKVLIADEPTTALDVTIQAQILELLDQLRQEFSMAIILITHDMGVIARMAERVVVMYAGRVAEEGPVNSVFKSPGHPYTAGLLTSIPRLSNAGAYLHPIQGMVPSASMMPPGCRFSPRCGRSRPICDRIVPQPIAVGDGHSAACLVHTGFELPGSTRTRVPSGATEIPR